MSTLRWTADQLAAHTAKLRKAVDSAPRPLQAAVDQDPKKRRQKYGNKVTTVAGDALKGTDMSLRASVGASIIWASPFGPLRFDYAVPIKKESFDEVQRFKFGIATQF